MYSHQVSSESDQPKLYTLWSLRFVFYGVAAVVCLPLLLLAIVTMLAYRQADQIASFEITTSVLEYSAVTVIPFFFLALFTAGAVTMR